MKIGPKIGPLNWKQVLSEITPECCEVWFRLDKKDEFNEIFEALREKKVPFGIHFWAVLPGGYEPNLVYDRDGIADQTEDLMKITVDLAANVGATYLNIHPGSFKLRALNLDKSEMKVQDSEIAKEVGFDSLLARSKRLDAYARERNILFLLETLPKNELEHWRDATGRKNVAYSGNITPDLLEQLGKEGLWLTNDFGHTIATWDDKTPEELGHLLFEVSKRLAPFTHLIHLNTVKPPFNGTDSHNGVLPEDFSQDVLPNKEQVIELLKLFKDREDVWVVSEAAADKMVANYWEMKNLIKSLDH